jgi:hypothetical protein
LLKFGFANGTIDPLTHSASTFAYNAYGYTQTERSDPRGKVTGIWIFLNYKACDALIRNDLTDCDRLGLQWQIAETVVHECTHALNYLVSLRTIRDAAGTTGVIDSFEVSSS